MKKEVKVIDAIMGSGKTNFAIKYMKENPHITISDAIIFGYEEWIK
jgi:hypothetical protein